MKNKDRKAILRILYACELILIISALIKLSDTVALSDLFSPRDGTMFTAGVVLGPMIIHRI